MTPRTQNRSLKGRGLGGDLLKYAQSLGFSVDITRNSHFRFTKPGCTPVFSSSSPSDQRALNNAKADLRRSDAGRRFPNQVERG